MATCKTTAIREAAKYVTINGQGTSWTIYGPYSCADLSGPSTESTASSYVQAVRIRTAWRAIIALALMERLDGESEREVESIMHAQYGAAHDIESVVSAAAAKFGAGPTAAEIAEAAVAYWDEVDRPNM